MKLDFYSYLVALMFFILGSPGYAQQLQWESEELKLNPLPTDTKVIGHFKFKNIGSSEANIKSVRSSCSCTILNLEKKTFAPNETGELMATFVIGARTGFQQKPIAVESNDSKRPVTMLMMKVTIPEIAQMRPNLLSWSPGEPPVPKEISFKVMNGFPVNAITVESSNPKITAKIELVKPGQEYRVIVTPSEADHPITAMLSIKTDYPAENPKTFFANIRVQPKK